MLRNNAAATHSQSSRLVPAIGVCVSVFLCLFVYVQITRRSQSTVNEIPATERQVLTVQKPQTTETEPESGTKSEYRNEVIRGQVVWLAEALQSQFGISMVAEAAENTLAILTECGEVLPIVENLRGRAFRKDGRLRGMDMEILARRYEKQPVIQIVRIYQIKEGLRYELDYWCDVCAIVMYEAGPCACCQATNQLRMQLVKRNVE